MRNSGAVSSCTPEIRPVAGTKIGKTPLGVVSGRLLHFRNFGTVLKSGEPSESSCRFRRYLKSGVPDVGTVVVDGIGTHERK